MGKEQDQSDVTGEEIDPPPLALKIEGKATSHRTELASRSRKRQANRFSPTGNAFPPPPEYLEGNTALLSEILALWDPFWISDLQNCKTVNLCCLVHCVVCYSNSSN